jgi:ABC-type sulfate/molybdate transport systems ATPase subunit
MLEVSVRHTAGSFELSVDFQSAGSPTIVVGPSGAGKSMTLRCITGIVRPREGRIVLEGRVLFDGKAGVDVPPQLRRVGYVPQEYALFPHLTVEGNVGFGLRADKHERRERVEDLLSKMDLAGQRRLRPHQLSGGQRQRVAIARALAVEPDLLLLDEPFTALDRALHDELRRQVAVLAATTDVSVLIVTHDPEDAAFLRGTVVEMAGGHVVRTAPDAHL